MTNTEEKVRKETAWSVAIAMGLLAVHALAEKSTIGRKLESWSYEVLMGAVPAPTKRLPIVVVDIGSNFDEGVDERVNMTKLAGLLDEVAQQDPSAIGIDIDFGALPGSAGRYPDVQDKVVRKALALGNKGIHVFLTVGRGLSNSDSNTWLGRWNYADTTEKSKLLNLVTHPFAPKLEQSGEILLFDSIQLPASSKIGDVISVPSLSQALANAYRTAHNTQSTESVSWYLEPYAPEIQVAETLGNQLENFPSSRYYVNTSALDRLQARAIRVNGTGPIDKWSTDLLPPAKSIFIIGSTAPNMYSGPIADTGIPDVYLHALGTYTRLFSPIYVVEYRIQILTSIVSVALPLILVANIRRRYLRSGKDLQGRQAATWSAAFLAIAAYCFAVFLARMKGILWLDWMLILAFLLLHPGLEYNLFRLSAQISSTVRKYKGKESREVKPH